MQFLANKKQDFLNFDLQNCIVIFDAEQVYLRLHNTNVKNSLEITWSFENPKPYTPCLP